VSGKNEARELLLDLIGAADAANQGTTPEQAVDDAIHEALLNQPALRTCLVPGCLRQYDAITTMTGETPPRPEWSGKGWATLGRRLRVRLDTSTADLARRPPRPVGAASAHRGREAAPGAAAHGP
jgi:hypothetical protein